MSLIRPVTLLLAAAMASPAIWQAFVTQTVSVQTALIRFLIAVPVAMLLLAGVRMVTDNNQRQRLRTKFEKDSAEVLPPDRSSVQ